MDGRKGVLGSENGMCGGRGEVKSMIHSGKGKQLSGDGEEEGGGIGYTTGVLGWTRQQWVSRAKLWSLNLIL